MDAVSGGSNNAYELMEFYFKGIPAHAGGAPWLGRSALDAVELMNVGANYLREHIIPGGRLHYIIFDGGEAPNIVPEHAAVRYSVRAPLMDEMQDIVRRLILCAEGAAHMTETKMTYSVKSIMHNMMPNYTMNEVMYEALCETDPVEYTDEIKNTLAAELKAEKENTLFSDQLNAWVSAAQVTYTAAGNAYLLADQATEAPTEAPPEAPAEEPTQAPAE